MKPVRVESAECREWADAWHSHRARAALESNLGRAGFGEEEFWSRYASWVATFRGDYPGVLLNRMMSYAKPGGTVLDIGAGTGAFAIPLAAVSRRVTAVEPSPSQVRQLRLGIERANVRNVNVVESRWEDLDAGSIEGHNLVLAVHSLQMSDVSGALRKMCGVASDCLLLVHSAGHSLAVLTEELFDIEPGPDYTYLCRILRGLGYDPAVEFVEYGYEVPLDVQMEILRYNPGLDEARCGRLRDHVINHGMTSALDDTLWLRRSCRDALISVHSRTTQRKESTNQ